MKKKKKEEEEKIVREKKKKEEDLLGGNDSRPARVWEAHSTCGFGDWGRRKHSVLRDEEKEIREGDQWVEGEREGKTDCRKGVEGALKPGDGGSFTVP